MACDIEPPFEIHVKAGVGRRVSTLPRCLFVGANSTDLSFPKDIHYRRAAVFQKLPPSRRAQDPEAALLGVAVAADQCLPRAFASARGAHSLTPGSVAVQFQQVFPIQL